MKKYIGSFFALFFILIISATLTLLYKQLKPKEVVSGNSQLLMASSESNFDFLSFEEEILNNDGEYYLWFCDNSDDNCKYVENEYVNVMLNTLSINEFDNLIKIDFSSCPFSKKKLQDKYNVLSTLAFVKVVVSDGKITYSESLSWQEDDPFTYEELKQWLYKHNIWQSNYSKKSQ